jgi:hypothetical protein
VVAGGGKAKDADASATAVSFSPQDETLSPQDVLARAGGSRASAVGRFVTPEVRDVTCRREGGGEGGLGGGGDGGGWGVEG